MTVLVDEPIEDDEGVSTEFNPAGAKFRFKVSGDFKGDVHLKWRFSNSTDDPDTLRIIATCNNQHEEQCSGWVPELPDGARYRFVKDKNCVGTPIVTAIS